MLFLRRFLRSFYRRKHDREMAEEMLYHLKQRTQANVADGLSLKEARFAAQRKFGNTGILQERARDQRGLLWLEQALQDQRYALRQLRRAPGFSVIVIASLALGIGANTALFSLMDDVLFRTLPVKNPHELVLLRCSSGENPLYTSHDGMTRTDPKTGRRSSTSLSYFIFERLRDHPGPFSALFAFAELQQLNVSAEGAAEIARGQLASGGYFAGLAISAARGRVITAEDDRPGAPPVAVISWRYWQTRFGGRDTALGQVIRVNNVAATVVGVTPPAFHGALQVDTVPDLTLPLALDPLFNGSRSSLANPTSWWLQIMGRLKPGVPAAVAKAEVEPVFIQAARDGWVASSNTAALADRLERSDPKLWLESGARGQNESRRDYEQPLGLLLGIVGVVLVIACVNVANLLLARAAVRAREFAVRLSLGASRGRLLRQLVLESLTLSFLGGGTGVLVAWWGRGALLQLRPIEGVGALDLNLTVLSFTVAVSLLTGLAFGLLPAWQATRIDLNTTLKSSGDLTGSRRFILRRALMVAQVALSVVLLVGAGLFLRTLHNLRTADAGFNRENLMLFRVDAALSGYKGPAIADLFDRLLERLRRTPGVQSAAHSRHPLLSGSRRSAPITVPGTKNPPPNPGTYVQPISAGFFSTLQIPLLSGRDFDARDTETSPLVAVVNEAFAKKFFPGENALGHTFMVRERAIEIVGIARDASYSSLRDPMPPTFYHPFRQDISGQANFTVRTVGAPAAIAPLLRAAVREVDANLPVFDLRTQEAQVTQLVAQERLFALLTTCFGGLALVLSCIGLYGLLAHQVTARTREIGLRMALGAHARTVVGLILTEGACLAVIGIVLGSLVASGLSSFISKLLYGVPATDPLTFLGVTLLLLTIAIAASLLPALRAARVDPMIALRAE